MRHVYNEKVKRETTEKVELFNQENIRKLREKENNEYFGIFEADIIKQMNKK